MMIDRENGRAYGIIEKGGDLSSYFCGGKFADYGTIERTVQEAFLVCEMIHREIGLYCLCVTYRFLGSVIGEAYHNATLRCTRVSDPNHARYGELIPSTELCYSELKKLVLRYTYNGWKFNEEIMSFIDSIH